MYFWMILYHVTTATQVHESSFWMLPQILNSGYFQWVEPQCNVGVEDLNTKLKTHNNQHKPPLLNFPAALHSPVMGRSAGPSTHGSAAPYCPIQNNCGQVWRHHGWFDCLSGAKQHSSNNERRTFLGLKRLKLNDKTQQAAGN
jgi:hypothetical protein